MPQFDIHHPFTTVQEALQFSAHMRFGTDTATDTVEQFISEVMALVELEPLSDALVGRAGQSGLSVEQRKRLTIAVELVANPSIVFMDEPTSGPSCARPVGGSEVFCAVFSQSSGSKYPKELLGDARQHCSRDYYSITNPSD